MGTIYLRIHSMGTEVSWVLQSTALQMEALGRFLFGGKKQTVGDDRLTAG